MMSKSDTDYLGNSNLFYRPYHNLSGIIDVDEENVDSCGIVNVIQCYDVWKSVKRFDFSSLMVFYDLKKKELHVRYPVVKVCHFEKDMIFSICISLKHCSHVFNQVYFNEGYYGQIILKDGKRAESGLIFSC
eukprot:TRINITY_DN422_c0_g1_i1.p1 TRINITY_DN422_c0_g1~~TRINITY_DN422_c0_g1_i1.p1  ORF type:complete len:132 (+),score=26.07 TRINITY_DN422_c0_g1_i1:621-1016(+)